MKKFEVACIDIMEKEGSSISSLVPLIGIFEELKKATLTTTNSICLLKPFIKSKKCHKNGKTLLQMRQRP